MFVKKKGEMLDVLNLFRVTYPDSHTQMNKNNSLINLSLFSSKPRQLWCFSKLFSTLWCTKTQLNACLQQTITKEHYFFIPARRQCRPCCHEMCSSEVLLCSCRSLGVMRWPQRRRKSRCWSSPPAQQGRRQPHQLRRLLPPRIPADLRLQDFVR